MLLLGLDAGGTSTRATLVTSDGTCVGFGTGAGGNPISSGPELAASGILTAIEAALAPSGSSLSDVGIIISAMAGSTAKSSYDWLLDPLRSRGFDGRVRFMSDLLATYFSGAFSSFGYAIVSGTGAAVIRVEDGEVAGTSDGLGWLLGDDGSGFWIGHHVAKAATADLDGRGPRTAVTGLLLDQLGIAPDGTRDAGRPSELGTLITKLYDMRPVHLARFAPLAFAAHGDAVAEGILAEAGRLLAHSVEAVHTRPGPLVMGGSILAQPGALADAFASALRDRDIAPPEARVSDGAVGSAVLALREHGVTVDGTMHRRVSDSVAAAR